MSERVALVMEPRERTGKGENGRLRREGWVPCVFYGPEMEHSVHGKLKRKEIERLLVGRWESLRIDMKLPDGSEEMCIIREVQRNPLTDAPLHIDFYKLIRGRRIRVNIPVEIIGRDVAPGVKDGGVLESLRELEVDTLPRNIPSAIEVDISALHVGDAIHVKDLKMPDDVEPLADPDEIVAVIVTSRGVDATASEDTGSAADVEVVAKGKAAKGDE